MECLEKLANVRSGFSFREGLEDVRPRGLPVVQIKNLSPGGMFNSNKLVHVDVDSPKPEHFLRRGEILFAARGSKHRAGVFDCELPEVLAASQFLVVRVREPERVLPAYLAWYLNTDEAQHRLNSMVTSATIPHVSITMLNKLEVAVPPVDIQRRIVDLDALGREEIEKMKLMIEEKKVLNRARLVRLLRGAMEDETDG